MSQPSNGNTSTASDTQRASINSPVGAPIDAGAVQAKTQGQTIEDEVARDVDEEAKSPPSATSVSVTPAAEDHQSLDGGCGEPYPCRLQAVIDHTDWQPVLSALSFAMQTNVKTRVEWSGNQKGHKGYVQQNGQKESDPHCKIFYIGSNTGGYDKVTACQQAGGAITVK